MNPKKGLKGLVNNIICITARQTGIRVVVGGWRKSLWNGIHTVGVKLLEAARNGARFAVLDQPHCCVKRMRSSFDDKGWRGGYKRCNWQCVCCDSRIWIVNTRLFLQSPTTTRVTSSVVVKQIVLFTMLQSFSLGFLKSATLFTTEWWIKSNEWLL